MGTGRTRSRRQSHIDEEGSVALPKTRDGLDGKCIGARAAPEQGVDQEVLERLYLHRLAGDSGSQPVVHEPRADVSVGDGALLQVVRRAAEESELLRAGQLLQLHAARRSAPGPRTRHADVRPTGQRIDAISSSLPR